ncbi:MAG TPA: DUF11 domain-containing protein [Methylomirabilota bacterium]|jgi:hypothetical protein
MAASYLRPSSVIDSYPGCLVRNYERGCARGFLDVAILEEPQRRRFEDEHVVVNLGPANASGVVVRDTLPAGTTFVSAVCTAVGCTTGNGTVNCTVSPQGTPCAFANGVVTCNIGALAPFTLASPSGVGIRLVVHVTAPAGSTLTNTGVVSAANPDPRPGNNSSTVATRVSTAD